MFPFSQEMSSDEAALIPLAPVGRRRGLSGESLFPGGLAAWYSEKGHLGRQSPRPPFLLVSPRILGLFCPRKYPLGRPPLSCIPALRPGASATLPLAGDRERGPRLLRGLCRPKGDGASFPNPPTPSQEIGNPLRMRRFLSLEGRPGSQGKKHRCSASQSRLPAVSEPRFLSPLKENATFSLPPGAPRPFRRGSQRV